MLAVRGEIEALAEYNHQTRRWRRDPTEARRLLRDAYEAFEDEDEDEERGDLGQSWVPNQVTGVVLLVAAVIQAKVYNLSLYHALIVINLSWLSHLTALGLTLTSNLMTSPTDFIFGWKRGPSQFTPYLICSLHLTATAAFSIWVFSNLDTFGDLSGDGCNSGIHYWVFGHQVSATADGFRRAGLVISGVAICPLINLSLETAFFGIVNFVFQLPSLCLFIVLVAILCLALFSFVTCCIPTERRGRFIDSFRGLPSHYLVRRVYGQAMPYIFVIIIFVIATEELIVINRDLVSEGEGEWTFGQTLAMFVLLPVVLDVWSKLRKAWSLRLRRKDGSDGSVPLYGMGEEEEGQRRQSAVAEPQRAEEEQRQPLAYEAPEPAVAET